jgi:hypothetical protein
MPAKHFLRSRHAIHHGRYGRTVDNHDAPFATEFLRDKLGREAASLQIVGHHGRRHPALRCHIDCNHHDARGPRFFHCRRDALRVRRPEHDEIDLRRDEVLDVIRLQVEIVIRGQRVEFHPGAAQFARLRFRALRHLHEKRIAQIAYGEPDRFQRGLGGGGPRDDSQRRQQGEDGARDDAHRFHSRIFKWVIWAGAICPASNESSATVPSSAKISMPKSSKGA